MMFNSRKVLYFAITAGALTVFIAIYNQHKYVVELQTKCQNQSQRPTCPPRQENLQPTKNNVHKHLHYPLMLYEGFDNTAESSLIIPHDQGTANIVFFIWCGSERLFQFKHMLAVLSAIKVQQPLKVILYHWPGKPPKEDLYNNWLSELKNTFYNFQTSELPNEITEPERCGDSKQLAPVLSHLTQGHGGIYIRENVLLRKAVNSQRSSNTIYLKPGGVPGLIIARELTIDSIVNPTAAGSCTTYTKLNQNSPEPCISMEFNDIYPKDIMSRTDPFCEFCRLLFYGSTEVKKPVYDLSNPIPNIGHFYLLGENEINFFIYLSILSMVNVLNVEAVYVHGDKEPIGHYWHRLKDTGKVVFVYCPPVQTVFGNDINPNDKFHGKDILSVYFLYLYGGVFIDWDAVFTRPLDDAIRGYDAVIGFDWFVPPEAPTFPEVINPGILAAKRHSVFISMWLEKYKDFGKGGFYYTGLLVPYKLYEHYPETVKLDEKFQVICWMSTCHPPWLNGYQKESFHSEFDWQSVYSVHFTYPDPPEFYNEQNLKNATTMIGRIGQRVMGYF